MKTKSSSEARRQYLTKVKEEFPETMIVGETKFIKKISMRYGENPGYPAAFYVEAEASGPNMATMEILQEGTKGLSYINVADMDLGQRLLLKLHSIYPEDAIAVLVKHEMPSGVARAKKPIEAFELAWGCDSLSNFGSVNVFNFEVNEELAPLLIESARNIEVIYAPSFTPEALAILANRKTLRLCRMAPLNQPACDNGLEIKRLAGGLLVQKRFDSKITSPSAIDVVSLRKPTEEEIEAALFNWIVACFTRSNAVVIGQKDKIHGIGSGQRSRIDAAENAIRLSRRGYGPQGCVLASDAFMPFSDVVELAAANGITAVIAPLGSIRDDEVLRRADELNLAFLVTRKPGEIDSERAFLHR
ncbi:MAG: hypothetical protein N3B16_08180 [Candidatus Aminicenantes bacterium]|nr:hypothetical protein [Candidatus Aminicenantes bacterium]